MSKAQPHPVSSVSNLSGASQFIYDEAGQLVKEIVGSASYEYAYDSKGNISSRETYSNGTLTKTDTFTYGADSWEDRLTGYNNKTITYDSIGNPTAYLGAALSWRGRELVGYEKGNKQISYSYDVDGMRYRKTVKTNGVETARYDYVYSDGKLILLTYTANGTSNTARFIYDSWGEPRGFILNNTAAYIYLKNAQGDITAIADENGEVLLTYTYTAWGKVTYSATSMQSMLLAATLSNVNPFTYRGYCYDYDIGMYYLQSRYYDPEICRFINADSTDYLGATGTLLSYNLFAYCENDGVNFVDATGTWGRDVHAGYYKTKNINQTNKGNTPKITTYWYKSAYVPYVEGRGYYGTFYWALYAGFSSSQAKKIAKACYDVDSKYSPVIPSKNFDYNQSFHFNTNEGKSIIDSRMVRSIEMLLWAIEYFEGMVKYKKERNYSVAVELENFALMYLGYCLHPLQDFYAHTYPFVEFCLKKDAIRLLTKEKINVNMKVLKNCKFPTYNGQQGFWHHIGTENNKKITDNVLERGNAVWNAGKATIEVLQSIHKAYY